MRPAVMTKGYPFVFQTIGYFMWEHPNEPEKAAKDAKESLIEFAYRKIWSELSAKDKESVLAIAQVPSEGIFRIRDILNYTSNQFNPYRDRLIKAGVITGLENGRVNFTVPWFREFALSEGNMAE